MEGRVELAIGGSLRPQMAGSCYSDRNNNANQKVLHGGPQQALFYSPRCEHDPFLAALSSAGGDSTRRTAGAPSGAGWAPLPIV